MEAINEHRPSAPTSNDELLALSHRLYAALTGGHDRLGYNVQGTFALWARGRGGRGWEPVADALIVPRGEWRPCMEVRPDGSLRRRVFNPYTLSQHLAGKYDVAPEAPSWSPGFWIDLDYQGGAFAFADAGDEVIPERALEAAQRDLDARLAAVWRALELGSGREPLLTRSPGLGYHLGCPLTRGPLSPHEQTWPAETIIEWVSDTLRRAGVELRSGAVELFPGGTPLRAPCGRGQILLRARRPDCPDALELEPVPGTVQARRWSRYGESGIGYVRRPVAMARAYLDAWEATARPLDVWLRRPEIAWSPAWGPFNRPPKPAAGDGVIEKNEGMGGADEIPRSQHKDEGRDGRRCRPSGGGLSSVLAGKAGRAGAEMVRGMRSGDGLASRSTHSTFQTPTTLADAVPLRLVGGPGLRFGREFHEYVSILLRDGVSVPGTRHSAILSVVFAWHASGLGLEEIRTRLDQWFRGHKHASKDLAKGEAGIRQSMREGMHYARLLVTNNVPRYAERGRVGIVARSAVLVEADWRVLDAVAEDVRREARELLAYFAGHANKAGAVLDPIPFGVSHAAALVGDRRVARPGRRRARAAVVAIEELERLGVLTLHCDYSTGNHARVWCCWYVFGSGVVPRVVAPGESFSVEAPAAGPRRVDLEDGRVGRSDPAKPAQDALDLAALDLAALEVSWRVLAVRQVPEGSLYALSDGTREGVRSELVPKPGLALVDEGGGGHDWWRKRYARRRFTPREFFEADFAVVVAGPWAHRWPKRRPSPAPEAPGGSYDPPAVEPARAVEPVELAAPAELAAIVDPDLLLAPAGGRPVVPALPIAVVPELAGVVGGAWDAWERAERAKKRGPEGS